MTPEGKACVALLWRGDEAERRAETTENNRYASVFATLARHGLDVRPAVYTEALQDEVREQLLQVDGVIVWVNPLVDGRDRSALDPMLSEVAARGVWVSTHPDVILKMGTKEVVFRTRHLGWGSDCRLYETQQELREQLPAELASGAARVLKRHRGHSGDGVWKVRLADVPASEIQAIGRDTLVEILHAQRGSTPRTAPLEELMAICEPYFERGGCVLDQAFQPRLPDGMIRCYMVHDRVAGFGHQRIKALLPPPPEGPTSAAAMPGPRIMHPASEPAFQQLRVEMETNWLPAMQELLDIGTEDLPVIWDADFLYGPRTASGEDTYVLCEINVSCVFPFPDYALDPLASAAVAAIRRARTRRPE